MAFAKMDGGLDMNPKIRRGGRNAREVFLFVLRRVAERDNDGWVPELDLDEEYLADVLMMPVTDVRDGVTRCRDVGLVTFADGRCVVVGWDDEWGKRPMSPRERAAKYRAGKPKVSNGSETVTERHEANVTERDCHVGEEKRGEEEDRPFETDGSVQPDLGLVPSDPDPKKPKPDRARELAEAGCAEINRLTGRSPGYSPTNAETLKLCGALAKAGFTVEQVVRVVRSKAEWLSDDKMARYFRPATLFALAKFRNYLEDLEAGPARRGAASTASTAVTPPTSPTRMREFVFSVKPLPALDPEPGEGLPS